MTENPLFIIPVSSGLIFIIMGFIILKYPPKKINGIYGYRTGSSMKNQERWDFAQIYSAQEIIRLGIILALLGLIGLIYFPNEGIAVALGIGLLLSTVIILLIRVELAIKKKFYKTDKKKSTPQSYP